MLRRILGFTFTLLIFALAFSIGVPDRTTTPSDLITVQSESPGSRIVAALFLPHVALAQSTAAKEIVVGPPVAAVDNGDHSYAILWVTLAVVAVVLFGAWFFTRRTTVNDASGGGYASGSTSGPSSRPQRPSAT
jgi:cytochrome oxidase assembly protein ShyY1